MKYILTNVLAILFCVAPYHLALAQELDLFAGNGLKNWVTADGQPVDSPKWELVEGVLHLTGGGGKDIFFRDWIGDFVLTFEWRISEKGNSGIKYRVQKYGNSWLGCEYQLQDDGTNPITKQSTASLYDVIEPSSARLPNPAGQWNTSRIVVIGNHVEHWLNGSIVVSTTAGSSDWLTRVNNSKFKPHPGWGQNPTGRLMLQDHGNEVWFRNVKLTLFVNHDSCQSPEGIAQLCECCFGPNCRPRCDAFVLRQNKAPFQRVFASRRFLRR